MPTIYIASDHAGYWLKEKIRRFLNGKNIHVQDFGNFQYDPHDDYPDFIAPMVIAAVKDKIRGIAICGSSHGACITANKIAGARAASVSTVDDAKLVREHNNANILCLAGRGFAGANKLNQPSADWTEIKKIINIWLATKFSRAKRHQRRLDKLSALEVKR